MIIATLLASWLWSARYEIMENYIKEALSDYGFEAELDIVSATDSAAIIRDIKIERDGEPVISATELRLDYLWPDIRDGKIERVEIDRPNFTLRLDEKGQFADAWLADMFSNRDASNEGPSPVVKSIGINEGQIKLLSPMGQANLTLDTEITDLEKFDASLTLASAKIDHHSVVAEGHGVIDISRIGSFIELDGQIESDRLSFQSVLLEDANIRIDGTFDISSKSYAGAIGVIGENIQSEAFAAKAMNLDWAGDIHTTQPLTVKGAWALSAQDAKLTKADRIDAVAETLSLYPALSVLPVSEHYASSLKSVMKDFFTKTQFEARGELDYGASGFSISTREEVTLISKNNRLILTPLEGKDIYLFNRADQTLQAHMSARFQNPVGLKLKNIDLRAKTPNGYQLSGVTGFSAQIDTNKNWVTTADDKRPVRLGPLSTYIDYKAGEVLPRTVTLNTKLDYDGPVPGGRVENLDLNGRIDVRLYEDWQSLDFTPKTGTFVTLGKLETPTDWTLADARFQLPATKKIFVRKPSESILKANLNDAEFMAMRPANPIRPAQSINVTAQSAMLNGILSPNQTQNWSIALGEAQYESETLPGRETRAHAQQAKLTAQLSPNMPVQIHLTSPSIMATTPMVDVKNMGIELKGTPDAYDVSYKGGTLKVIGSEAANQLQTAGYASFPLEGQVRFTNGRFEGQADLKIAKAGNAAVKVDYTYANGAGEADIDIPSVIFAPNGLQPQQLLPSLRGKISRVTGKARAQFRLAFEDGAVTHSEGQLDLVDMDIATAPGPLEGVNTTIKFNSLWPVETSEVQTLTMESFNPGYAMKNGVMTYRMMSDGIIVESAKWPIGAGWLTLEPFTWRYLAEENRVVMRVENISLNDILSELESKKLEATGTVTGSFPIVVRGVQVLVESGEIAVPDGGVIKYNSGLPGKTYTQEEALAVFREKRSNEYAALARDALKEFSYRSLRMGVNGPLDGRIDVGLVFDGSNPKVLNSQPFRFNLNVGGKLLNILQSFNSNAQIKSEILNQTGLNIDRVPSDEEVP